ncbi:MAG: hypothetical protein U1E47_03810 [Rivihabitans pingtungensis]
MSAMSGQQDELDQLRKRARRRLVGAIVMSLRFAVAAQCVLDSKPQHEMRPETVDIVSNLPGQQPAKAAGEAAATTRLRPRAAAHRRPRPAAASRRQGHRPGWRRPDVCPGTGNAVGRNHPGCGCAGKPRPVPKLAAAM